MEKNLRIFYIESLISDKKRIKYVAFEGICAGIEEESIIKCKENLEYQMKYKDHVIMSPYTADKTVLEFAKKLKLLRERFDDTLIIDKLLDEKI